MSVSTSIQSLQNNDPTFTTLSDTSMDVGDRKALFKALSVNQILKECCFFKTDFGEFGAAELANYLKKNHSLTKLSLFGSKFSDEGFKLLCTALKTNTYLLRFSTNEKIETEKALALADVINVNRTLKVLYLDLSQISSEAFKIIAKTLKGKHSLQELRFDNGQLDSEGVEILAEALKTNCALQTLYFYQSSVPDFGLAIANALKENTNLQSLSFYSSFGHKSLNNKSGKAFADMLKENKTLTILDLSGNFLGEDATLIAESMEKNDSLLELNLGSCFLPSSTSKAVARMLTINCTLLELNIYQSQLDQEGSEVFAQALMVNNTLKTIYLSRCNLGPEGGMAFVAVIKKKNSTLKHLSLGNNKLGIKTQNAIARALMENSSLETLSMGDNDSGDEFAIELSEALKKNFTLKHLELFENNFSNVGINALAEALKVNTTLQTLPHGIKEIFDASSNIRERLAFNISLADKPKKEKNEKDDRKGTEKPPAPHNQQQQKQQTVAKPLYSEERKDDGKGDRSLSLEEDDVEKVKDFAAVPTAMSSTVSSEAVLSLDADDIEKVKALPEAAGVRTAMATAKALENIDLTALNILKRQAERLQELFEVSVKAHHTDAEIGHINDNPILDTYYRYFSRQLTSIWLACLTINSRMIKNSEQYNSDYFAAGLKKIGDHIPGISIATSIIEDTIGTWNEREKRIGVQRIALLFRDLETAFKELCILARQLTLSQEEALKKLLTKPKGLVDKIGESFSDITAAVLADDIDDPIKRKAAADCKIMITAIKEGKYEPKAAVASLLTVIMGKGFVYTSTISITASTTVISGEKSHPQAALHSSAGSAGAGMQTPTMGEMYTMMQQMQETVRQADKRAKDAEKSAKEADDRARRAEELAKKNGGSDVTVSGGHSAMALASPHSHHVKQAENTDKRLAAVEKQVGTLTHASLEHQEGIRGLEQPKKGTVAKAAPKKNDEDCVIM
ncbi:MAG: hypothetical protein H0W88_11040 [Parachlamydiaceae bacterium]|nr:hypothetical protein [Parachlamydiaceae bacterium]